MIDTVVVQPGVSPGTAAGSASPGVSWPAIVAGAVVSLALTLVLIAFGTGLGLSAISPWSGSGISATTFKITTGIYLVVIAMISSSLGGYIAGRLRSGWDGIHSDEVYFRDTAHGFVAWALASVLGAILMAAPVTHVASGGAMGAAQGAVNAASGPMDGYVDSLLRPANPSPQANGDSRGEVGRLVTAGLRSDANPADRDYLSTLVAARTGLSKPDADKRVNDVINKAKADADAARKATAALAFWLTASLLLGAFCASLAATEGGALRDGTWRNRRVYRS